MAKISNVQGYVDPSESSMTEYASALVAHVRGLIFIGMTITTVFSRNAMRFIWKKKHWKRCIEPSSRNIGFSRLHMMMSLRRRKKPLRNYVKEDERLKTRGTKRQM